MLYLIIHNGKNLLYAESKFLRRMSGGAYYKLGACFPRVSSSFSFPFLKPVQQQPYLFSTKPHVLESRVLALDLSQLLSPSCRQVTTLRGKFDGDVVSWRSWTKKYSQPLSYRPLEKGWRGYTSSSSQDRRALGFSSALNAQCKNYHTWDHVHSERRHHIDHVWRRYKSSSSRKNEIEDHRNEIATGKQHVQDPHREHKATSSVTNKHILSRLPAITHIHRPSKEELLSAATGFWSRLKVRFKWFSIRSARPFNIDEIGAFLSWFLLGHVLWIVLGTTTFFSLAIFAVNTVFAQGMFFF